MMGNPMDELLRIAQELDQATAAGRSRAEQIIAARMARDLCTQVGHQYRVHGKTNPNKIECGRCHVTWTVGPRTEPPQ